VRFTHRGWPDAAAGGEMAMCGYTLGDDPRPTGRAGRARRTRPYFVADARLPRIGSQIEFAATFLGRRQVYTSK
jgi:hypothetical protein